MTKKTSKKNDPYHYITYYPSLKLKLSDDDDLYLNHRRPIYSPYVVEDYGDIPKKYVPSRVKKVTSRISKDGRLYNPLNNPVDIGDIKKYRMYSVKIPSKSYTDAIRKSNKKIHNLLDSKDTGGLQSWEEYHDLSDSIRYNELVKAARHTRARRRRSGKTSLRR